jgi:hypothetical protein
LFDSNYYAWDHYIYFSNYTKLVMSLDAYKVQSQEEEPLITRLESLPMTTMYMWPLCIWFINYQNDLLNKFVYLLKICFGLYIDIKTKFKSYFSSNPYMITKCKTFLFIHNHTFENYYSH